MALDNYVHRVCVAQLAHHVNLVCAAAARLVNVHGVATWEGGYVRLVIGIAEHVKVIHFYNFEVVF